MAKFSEHFSTRIETGKGEGLSQMTEKRKNNNVIVGRHHDTVDGQI